MRATDMAGSHLYTLLRQELIAHRVNLVGRRIELTARLRALRTQLDAVERAIEATEDIERCLDRAVGGDDEHADQS